MHQSLHTYILLFMFDSNNVSHFVMLCRIRNISTITMCHENTFRIELFELDKTHRVLWIVAPIQLKNNCTSNVRCDMMTKLLYFYLNNSILLVATWRMKNLLMGSIKTNWIPTLSSISLNWIELNGILCIGCLCEHCSFRKSNAN